MALQNTIDPILSEKWNREAHTVYNEGMFQLDGTFRKLESNDKTFHFPIIGDDEEAYEGKARHQKLVITTTSTDDATVTPTPIYQARMIDDWDAFQTQVSYRKDIAKIVTKAVHRKMTTRFIAALTATTNSETTLPTANAFNHAGAVKMAEVLDVNNVDSEGRYGLLSPAAFSDLRVDQTVIDNRYMSNNTVKTNEVGGIAGFEKFYQTTLLQNGAAGATERRCWTWQKGAVGGGQWQPFSIEVNYLPEYKGWLYTASVAIDFVIIDNKGVQFCDVAQ